MGRWRHASARRQLDWQLEGMLRRCACSARDTPKTCGGCCSLCWPSVGNCKWTDWLSFGPVVATGRSSGTVETFCTLCVIARSVGLRVACVYDGLTVCTACVPAIASGAVPVSTHAEPTASRPQDGLGGSSAGRKNSWYGHRSRRTAGMRQSSWVKTGATPVRR